MFENLRNASLQAKFVAGFAAGAILGFGLCTASVLSGLGQGYGGRTALLASYCFYFCVAGLVGSLIWWSVAKRGGK